MKPPIPRVTLAVLLSALGLVAQNQDADRLLQRLIDEREVPGLAAVVVSGERVLYERALGVAEVGERRPMTLDTPLAIASLSKCFVAALTVSLAEADVVDLDAPVRQWVDEIPESWPPITLRHLLSHTAGVADYIDFPNMRQRYQREAPRAEILAELLSHAPAFEPATRFDYSNGGFHLVGHAIEQAAGDSLANLLRDRVFQPAGMARARLLEPEADDDDVAVGYVAAETGVAPAPYSSRNWSYAAGAVVASARDLAHWIQALARGEVLERAQLRTLWTATRLPDGSTAPYGLGHQLQRGANFTLAYHTGRKPGFHATMGTLIEQRLSVIVLLNRDDVDSFPVAQRLAAMFRGAAKSR
ncbi:MAG: serine hydrolase domain-containing protein [Planctomycetota bacterium]